MGFQSRVSTKKVNITSEADTMWLSEQQKLKQSVNELLEKGQGTEDRFMIIAKLLNMKDSLLH